MCESIESIIYDNEHNWTQSVELEVELDIICYNVIYKKTNISL